MMHTCTHACVPSATLIVARDMSLETAVGITRNSGTAGEDTNSVDTDTDTVETDAVDIDTVDTDMSTDS